MIFTVRLEEVFMESMNNEPLNEEEIIDRVNALEAIYGVLKYYTTFISLDRMKEIFGKPLPEDIKLTHGFGSLQEYMRKKLEQEMGTYAQINGRIIADTPKDTLKKEPIEEKKGLSVGIRKLEDLPVSDGFLNSLSQRIEEAAPKLGRGNYDKGLVPETVGRQEKWELKRELPKAPERAKVQGRERGFGFPGG